MSRAFLQGVYCGYIVSPSRCIATYASAEASSQNVCYESHTRQQTRRQGLCGPGDVSRYDDLAKPLHLDDHVATQLLNSGYESPTQPHWCVVFHAMRLPEFPFQGTYV